MKLTIEMRATSIASTSLLIAGATGVSGLHCAVAAAIAAWVGIAKAVRRVGAAVQCLARRHLVRSYGP